MRERLTIYQWAAVWTPSEVDERIEAMCAPEPEPRVLVDANVFVSFSWGDARWGEALWGDDGAGSHHD